MLHEWVIQYSFSNDFYTNRHWSISQWRLRTPLWAKHMFWTVFKDFMGLEGVFVGSCSAASKFNFAVNSRLWILAGGEILGGVPNISRSFDKFLTIVDFCSEIFSSVFSSEMPDKTIFHGTLMPVLCLISLVLWSLMKFQKFLYCLVLWTIRLKYPSLVLSYGIRQYKTIHKTLMKFFVRLPGNSLRVLWKTEIFFFHFCEKKLFFFSTFHKTPRESSGSLTKNFIRVLWIIRFLWSFS